MEFQEQEFVEVRQPLPLYSKDLLGLALDYIGAFEALDVKRNGTLIRPAYQLLSHATELGFKAFLVSKGVGVKGLKNLDHRLAVIYPEAVRLGLPDVDKLNHLVDRLADMNEENSLRYPAYSFGAVPDADECAEVCRSLLSTIYGPITEAGAFAMLSLRAKHPQGSQFAWVGEPE